MGGSGQRQPCFPLSPAVLSCLAQESSEHVPSFELKISSGLGNRESWWEAIFNVIKGLLLQAA